MEFLAVSGICSTPKRNMSNRGLESIGSNMIPLISGIDSEDFSDGLVAIDFTLHCDIWKNGRSVSICFVAIVRRDGVA
jgi:hypothetical protein